MSRNGRFIDLTGMIFDDWVVLGQTSRTKYWRCWCICGESREVFSGSLRNGTSRGCGCTRQFKPPFEALYNVLKYSAKEREVEMLLSFEDFYSFTKILSCHYCEAGIKWFPYVKWGGGITKRYHLDRKDSRQGYSKENCVVCCTRCNYIKGIGVSYETMLEFGTVLKNRGENQHDLLFSNRR